MIKVITYGTYDFLHHGHIRLLERAKQLGDYLIVGVTAEDFDKTRGKINVQQTLMERVEAVKALGIADEIIVEEYEGQKIDDIQRYDIDIFTVGSDWEGKFDYLNEYCKVVYLDRTTGISSTDIREKRGNVTVGIVGYMPFLNKFVRESYYVNGIDIIGICTDDIKDLSEEIKSFRVITDDFNELLKNVDAVYIHSNPSLHYQQALNALSQKKHVLCESPLGFSEDEINNLYCVAEKNGCILMEGIRTAYAMAYSRLLLLLKSGVIGRITSVDAVCTSLRNVHAGKLIREWSSISAWGPTALLPVYQILGTDYCSKSVVAQFLNESNEFDTFVKINYVFKDAVASIMVGNGVKSEGELVISGTKGYVYVPAPWWKTDYFEIRFENPVENRRFFYQLDGEGLRYELVAFINAINQRKSVCHIGKNVSREIARTLGDFKNKKDVTIIQ